MDVQAVFELPVPIWIMCDALSATYSTGIRELTFNVVMPEQGSPPGPPPIVGLESRPELLAEDVAWTKAYAATIPDSSLEPATALLRIGISDVDGPTYPHKLWLTPPGQLAENVHQWFEDVRTWVEVITGQDLDPNHKVYDATLIGAGLTFVKPTNDEAQGLVMTLPHVTPLRASAWARILELARDGIEPPLEEVLSRDARAAQRRNANRRAIIEAATALEIALGRHVRKLAGDGRLPEKQRKRIKASSALGDYIAIARDSGLKFAVDLERLKWLKDLRNDAAHEGRAPSGWDTTTAVQLMMDFLGAHGEVLRTEGAPGASEWIMTYRVTATTNRVEDGE